MKNDFKMTPQKIAAIKQFYEKVSSRTKGKKIKKFYWNDTERKMA